MAAVGVCLHDKTPVSLFAECRDFEEKVNLHVANLYDEEDNCEAENADLDEAEEIGAED